MLVLLVIYLNQWFSSVDMLSWKAKKYREDSRLCWELQFKASLLSWLHEEAALRRGSKVVQSHQNKMSPDPHEAVKEAGQNYLSGFPGRKMKAISACSFQGTPRAVREKHPGAAAWKYEWVSHSPSLLLLQMAFIRGSCIVAGASDLQIGRSGESSERASLYIGQLTLPPFHTAAGEFKVHLSICALGQLWVSGSPWTLSHDLIWPTPNTNQEECIWWYFLGWG